MTTKINPSEISSIVKKKIDGYKGAATEANVGEVLTTADGIVQIYGHKSAQYHPVSYTHLTLPTKRIV